MAAAPLVELLYFEGCPNHDGARELVERVAAEEGVTPELRLVEVRTAEAAQEMCFLGSPTIRVNGRDVEPSVNERDQYMLACRVYCTPEGFSGQPDPEWVRAALTAQRKL